MLLRKYELFLPAALGSDSEINKNEINNIYQLLADENEI
jgi:hypothetical protein